MSSLINNVEYVVDIDKDKVSIAHEAIKDTLLLINGNRYSVFCPSRYKDDFIEMLEEFAELERTKHDYSYYRVISGNEEFTYVGNQMWKVKETTNELISD